MSIKDRLYEMRNPLFVDFQAKLIPNIKRNTFLGIKNPEVRKLAKEYRNTEEANTFMQELPHEYFEEYLLHGYLIEEMKNFDKVIIEIEKLLPFIDNWATCDSWKPKVFSKNLDKALPYIKKWCKSKETYTSRFGIEMLMNFYLGDHFSIDQCELVSSIEEGDYYLNIMVAWYFATALAKQWDTAIKFIENGNLPKRTHNKTIQKARESFRISEEHKTYLKTLKR